jgi:hypothetical protein
MPIITAYPPLPLRYDGVLYRGINKDLNPIMGQKYDTYETAFAVGTKLTFPAPTACSTSDVVAGDFTNGIQLVIQKSGGVSLLPGQLSAYDESEVMLPFPSTFKVIARSKVQDTVVVVIEAVDTAFSYCSAPSSAPAPATAPAAASATALSILSSLSVDQVSLLVRTPRPHPTPNTYPSPVMLTGSKCEARFQQVHLCRRRARRHWHFHR